MNRHYAILAISLGSALAVTLESLASGYFINPTLLGIATLFVMLPIALVPIITLIVYFVWLLFSVRQARRWVFLGLALLAVSLMPLNPLVPKGFDAFVLRMRGVPSGEFYRLQQDVHTYLASRDLPAVFDQEAIYKALRGTHPLLTISAWQPRLGVTNGAVIIIWGSGLTGAYRAIIVDDPGSPANWKESRLSSRLYERVYLEWD